jgi:energy-coupling factor transporter transmembrane protein EcfT
MAYADLFVPGRSALHRLDPRVKFALALLAGALVLSWESVLLLATFLVLTQLVLWHIRYPRATVLTFWRTLRPFLLLIVLLWPVFHPGGSPVLVTVGPVHITLPALLAGVSAALRVASTAFIALLWLGTTDQRALVRGFVRLGMPFNLGIALTIGLRFIPLFAAIVEQVSAAMQSRGLILPPRGWRRLRALVPILIAALITSLRYSEQLGWALALRGVGAPRQRTALHDLTMRWQDWLALLAGSVLLGGLLLARVVWGLGSALLMPLSPR